MKLRIHGGAGTVTGSCFELADERLGVRVLVDAGAFQGEDGSAISGAPSLPDDPSSLNAVLLTHAHLDHCGRLPLLVRAGYRGKVYATPATATLARATLLDSARLSGEFSAADVDGIRWHTRNVSAYQGWRPVADDVFLCPIRSSHLLGATGFAVSWGRAGVANPVVVFSGDLGPARKGDGVEPLCAPNHAVDFAASAPRVTLVLESTYGARAESPRSRLERQAALADLVRRAARRGGPLLLAAFAQGRTQELLMDLAELRSRAPDLAAIPLAAPGFGLALEASKAYVAHLLETEIVPRRHEVRVANANRERFRAMGIDVTTADGMARARAVLACAFGLGPSVEGVQPPRLLSKADIAAFVSGGPAILVAPSGMAQGGAMRQALERALPDPKATVAFSGYVSRGTAGDVLLSMGLLSFEDRHRLDGDVWTEGGARARRADVRAAIVRLECYSAHASAEQLCDYALPSAGRNGAPARVPDRVLLVHGDAPNRRALARRLATHVAERCLSVEILLPEPDTGWIDLDGPGGNALSVPDISRRLDDLRHTDPLRFAEILRMLKAS